MKSMDFATLTVPNGQTESNSVTREAYGDAVVITLASDSGNTPTSPQLRASYDGGSTWFVIQDNRPLADLPLPDAGKCTHYYDLSAYPEIQIHLGAAASGDQKWYGSKQVSNA